MDDFDEDKADTEKLLRKIAFLDGEIREKRKCLQRLHNSPSWKLTAPLRFLCEPFVSAHAKLLAWRHKGHEAEAVLAGLRSGAISGVSKPGCLATRDRIYDSERRREARVVFSRKPRISIITPLYNTPPQLLAETIFSVIEQTYGEWELCLADASDPNHAYVGEIASFFSAKDKRIKYRKLDANGGISLNSNAAIEMASGDFIAILDHDDLFHPAALFKAAETIDRYGADLVYSDECITDGVTGKLIYAHYKPDFSPDLLRSENYICHLMVFSRNLMEKAGGPFRKEYDGSQDHDLTLRLSEKAAKIVHIPEILYFWRANPTSCAASINAKPYASMAGIAAVQASLRRNGIAGTVEALEDAPTQYRVRYEIDRPWLVSIIIPTRNQVGLLKMCIDSVVSRSTWRNYEILVVDNGSDDPVTLAYLSAIEREGTARVLRYNAPFNYSKINNFAAEQARGDMLLFLNNDTRVISRNWIEEMLMHAQRDGIGAVGAMLYYPNDTVQHAGVVYQNNIMCGHVLCGKPRGGCGECRVVRNYSAVTGACLMLRTEVFRKIGRFYEGLAVEFNDIDLCLRLRNAGYSVVWTPFAELYHFESMTRGRNDTIEKMKHFYSAASECLRRNLADGSAYDPFYNRNLILSPLDFKENKLSPEMREFSLRRQLAVIEREISAVQASASWRLFAPLRRLLGIKAFNTGRRRTGPGKFVFRRRMPAKSILFVSHELTGTGAPYLLAEAVRIAIENGSKVTVVSPMDGPLHQIFAALGATVVIDDSFKFDSFGFRRFAKKFDLVFINTVAAASAVCALATTRIPVVWWIHEGYFDIDIASKAMPRRLPDNVMAFVAHKYCTKALLRFGFDYSPAVLRYGLFNCGTENAAVPHQADGIVFALVGTVAPRKGQDVFIKAVKLLRPEVRSKARFVIQGSHPIQDFYREVTTSAKDIGEIEFREPLPHSEMATFYSGVSCVVIPSRDDTFPLIAQEASTFGIPAIVSDHTGAAIDFAGGPLAKLVFKSESAGELSEMMHGFISDPATLTAFGMAAKQKFEQLCNPRLFRKRISDVLTV